MFESRAAAGKRCRRVRGPGVNKASRGLRALFADVDAEGFHAAVEVAPVHAHEFGGARDVAFGLREFGAYEVALVGLSGFAEGGEARGRRKGLFAAERGEV